MLDTNNAWLSPAQLQGVQSRLNQLRSLPPTHGNRKALQTELEDDCRSVEYMVSCGGEGVDFRAPARLAMPHTQSDARPTIVPTYS